uniref:3-hydroxyisobutyryl-CoA hydrolase n=1 Tax=Solanum tuberosum TaxID=4113 RepID=M0ZG10_SOLTU
MKIIDRCFSRRTIEEIISTLIREGRLQGVDICLVCEYRIFCHVLRGEFNKDILEGFRAILIERIEILSGIPPEWN